MKRYNLSDKMEIKEKDNIRDLLKEFYLFFIVFCIVVFMSFAMLLVGSQVDIVRGMAFILYVISLIGFFVWFIRVNSKW